MQDNTWKDLEGGWDRLRWARMRWQREAGAVNPTADNAAQSLAIKPGTYRAYERPPGSSKHIALDHQVAARFARKFKVSWRWLLIGEGTPFDDDLSPVQERVMRAMLDIGDADQQTLADLAENLAKRARAASGG
jgi:hypothetical protein